MNRRDLFKAGVIVPFAESQHYLGNEFDPLELGDVVYGFEDRGWYKYDGLAMVTGRSVWGTYSVKPMPGSKIGKSAWWNRENLKLIERGAYYRALNGR